MKTLSVRYLSPGCGRRLRRRSAKLAANFLRQRAPFRRRLQPAFGQEQRSIPQAEAKHMVQPDGVAHDRSGEAMAIGPVGCGFMPSVSPGVAHAAGPGYGDNAR